MGAYVVTVDYDGSKMGAIYCSTTGLLLPETFDDADEAGRYKAWCHETMGVDPRQLVGDQEHIEDMKLAVALFRAYEATKDNRPDAVEGLFVEVEGLLHAKRRARERMFHE